MEFFTTLFVGYPLWVWLMFFGFVLALLAFDLGVLHKEQHEITVAESLKLSAFYICMGLLFGAWLWWYKGSTAGMEYLTGYLIEKSLSMDNVFVIALIFSSLGIPRLYQHRVLFWGILGVIVLRAIMIGLGAVLVAQYQGVLVLFGLFLIFTGVKMLFSNDEHSDIQDNKFYKWLRTKMRFTPTLHKEKFWVRGEDHQLSKGWWATPLFLALILVETADLVFAVDSIPAIFAITQDPFIVYTSNIFAILGLRALYFALAAMVHRFEYLKYALSVVLVFIGVKVGLVYFNHEGIVDFTIPTALSLGVTFGLLVAGVLYSLWKTRGQEIDK
ncbi:TerC family protein [Shewanella baltica]|uniref:Integral membrane protein TerC n=1 Tax=Shewanella baltica (strain OS155 / ATCC BAA-1091) TaxID=325240 RepID=A3D2V8_SHEB5|nr:TerC family protein [Shewanella baltica]ABN61071.1 Integral membrane protein TerC [Shewanella baltica OS155]AEH13419.1 Integral membrane protein TerC [Shewanella baltica OS117]MCS6127542.1 TerC family protein [Shewanella baltica]MCS6139572.1 TerC family protein [Shewanella baltica]MCS6145713.1 TerC family protein [Shewanella baltica]